MGRYPLTASVLPRSPALVAALFVAVPVVLGVLTLLLGWPRADRYPHPRQWRAGIALTAAWLIGWPLVFAYLDRYDLQAAWLYPVLLAVGSLPVGPSLWVPQLLGRIGDRFWRRHVLGTLPGARCARCGANIPAEALVSGEPSAGLWCRACQGVFCRACWSASHHQTCPGCGEQRSA
jgi:hypothetical protein